MCEDEVDAVAAELARAGGITWYSGREDGPLKIVKKRYRDRARLAIAALDRHRTATRQAEPTERESLQCEAISSGSSPEIALSVGVTVLYQPPGDRRAYQCKIEKIDGDRAYLMPDIRTCTGWIDIRGIQPADPGKISQS